MSCYAKEGALLLETADGQMDETTADRLIQRLNFPQDMPPLVVLAGCRTGLAGVATDEPDDALPALARELIDHGVPSVIAMNTDVSDDYATDLLSLTYYELSSHKDGPEPLRALSVARRQIEQRRREMQRDDPAAAVAEWPVAALHQRVRHHLLFNPAGRQGPVRAPSRPIELESIVDLGAGDFVGRRSELRKLVRELSGISRSRGVLIHGIGGVGKSSLAAQLSHMLSEQDPDNTLVIGVHGPHTADQLLNEIVKAVRLWSLSSGRETDLPTVNDQHYRWDERLALLDRVTELRNVRMLLLFDDPLGDPVESESETWSPTESELDPDLTALLGAWLAMKLATTLVITSRVRLALPNRPRISTHHLGPLSFAETRKLIFRLPALDALSRDEQRKAFEAVGGHPRALEYLDAVLSGGHRHRTAARRGTDKRFDAITDRLDAAFTASRTGLALDGDADLEQALRTTAAIASSDVLLDELVTGLRANFKAAYALLVAVSVHRQPIDDVGMRWSTGEQTAHPDRDARLAQVYQALLAAERDGTATSRRDLDLPQALHEQLNRDLSAATLLPAPTWLATETDRLARLTLLTPAPPDEVTGGSQRYLVHRWTAMSLVTMIDPGDLRVAHQRAAGYHRWRAHLWHANPDVYLRELAEVHYHSMQAGEQDRALAVAAEMCAALDLQGASAWEWELCQQTLASLRPDDVRGRVFWHRESVVALRRGDYEAAERLQRAAQELAHTAGDRIAVAAGLQQLGIIAQRRGDQATAEERYREAVRAAGANDIQDRLDARIVLAGCYQRLGGIALGRSDEDDAERFSIGAIEVATEIAAETGVATVHHDLAGLARALGDRPAADAHELRARDATAAAADVRRLLAAALLQMSAVFLRRHLFDEAMEGLEPAQHLAAEVGDRPLRAACMQLHGEAQVHQRDLAGARRTYEHFVELAEELDDTPGTVVAHQQLGRIASMLGEPRVALAEVTTAMAIARDAHADALVAATHLVTGGVLVAGGRSEQAAGEFAEGLRLADQLGQDGLAMGCVIQLALARLRTGDPDAAAELLADGYRRAEALNSKRSMAVCVLARAIVARQLGHDEESAEWHEEALALAKEEQNPRLIAECLARSGDLALDQGHPADAEELYLHCLEVLSGLNAQELHGQVLRQLARCQADRNAYHDTARALRAAAGDFAELEADEDELACVVRLAWALHRTGRPRSARRAMYRAGDLACGRKPSPTVVIGLLLAAEQACADGDRDKAVGYAEDARDAARAISDRWLIVDSSRVLAAVADSDTATQLLESSLAISVAQHDHLMTVHVHRELGLLRMAVGDERGARQHFTSSAELATELREQTPREAAQALCDGKPVDEIADVVAEADDDAADVVWLRRLRAVDGETAFATQAALYIGPSIDDIVRDLVPAFSGVASVPAVVSPSTTVRLS